jgi:GNAT superfamily N-acetyltransferase
MNYQFVNDDRHPLTALDYSPDYNNLPEDLRLHLKHWDLPEASHAILAYKDDQLVGVFRYSLSNRGQIQHLDAAGTWIDKSFRRKNIASTLWDTVINQIKPQGIYVYTTTYCGYDWICSLKEKYPNIVWEHTTEHHAF